MGLSPASGPGAASAVRTATVTLTDAQVKALPNTPAEIIAATEILNYSGSPSSLPMTVAAFAETDVSAGGYTNLNAPLHAFLWFGSDESAEAAFASFQSAPGDVRSAFGAPVTHGLMNFSPVPYSQVWSLNSSYKDNGLYLALDNGVLGNLTGGNAANSMRVTVLYYLLAL